MHIEINHRDALGTMNMTRPGSTYGHIVEQAKSHGPGGFGMMAGRAQRAKGVVRLPGKNRIDGGGYPANRPEGRIAGAWREHGIRVQRPVTGSRHRIDNTGKMGIAVDAGDVGGLAQGCFQPCKAAHILAPQGFQHGTQTGRLFGVPGAWIMGQTIVMPVNERGHGCRYPQKPRV